MTLIYTVISTFRSLRSKAGAKVIPFFFPSKLFLNYFLILFLIFIQLVDYDSFILSIFYFLFFIFYFLYFSITLPNGKEVCLHLGRYNERKEEKEGKLYLYTITKNPPTYE
jgi:hypothetical protein